MFMTIAMVQTRVSKTDCENNNSKNMMMTEMKRLRIKRLRKLKTRGGIAPNFAAKLQRYWTKLKVAKL